MPCVHLASMKPTLSAKCDRACARGRCYHEAVGTERRQHPRYSLRRQVTVRCRGQRFAAWTVDVSTGGIKLRMQFRPQPGDILEVEMPASGAGVMITPARVRHVRAHPDGVSVGALWMPAGSRVDPE